MKRVLLSLSMILALSACGENQKASEEASTTETEKQEITTREGLEEQPEAEAPETDYEHEVVVSGLDIPWSFTFLPDDSMLITEKSGELFHFKDGKKQSISGVPAVYNQGQGGLLDVALHPEYKSTGWIYLTFSSEEGEGDGGNTKLVRAKLNNNKLTDIEDLYKAEPNTTKGVHFGSRIVFDEAGHLYFTIGDRGNRDENPQDITRDGGKVYRLNLDGSIPEDNPFVGEENAKEAIFSYGHRNPQGMIYHPETGEVWLHEHGPQGGDEINIVKKGLNYGWPEVTYGINYDDSIITEKTGGPDFEEPMFYWLPSIAPSGFVYVTSDKYPDLKGDLLVGSLKFQYLEHLELDGTEIGKRTKLLDGVGRLRDVREGPDGFIYAAIEGTGIVKLLPQEEEASN